MPLVCPSCGAYALGNPARTPGETSCSACGRTTPANIFPLCVVTGASGSGKTTVIPALRERLPEAIGAAGVPHKLDVGVPLAALPEFAAGVREVAAPARVILFGHLGDGNVHVNLLGLAPEDDSVDGAVLELVAALGGTISAEHGVGVAKAARLGLTRDPGELRAMRAIKDALDPAGLLNPGVVLAPR